MIKEIANIQNQKQQCIFQCTAVLLYLSFYFTVALALFPGFWTEITPDHIHEHVQLSVSAGEPFTFISALPGAHGAVMAGTHGCGVNVPKAADVAVAT
jgi:hypothetical protein